MSDERTYDIDRLLHDAIRPCRAVVFHPSQTSRHPPLAILHFDYQLNAGEKDCHLTLELPLPEMRELARLLTRTVEERPERPLTLDFE